MELVYKKITTFSSELPEQEQQQQQDQKCQKFQYYRGKTLQDYYCSPTWEVILKLYLGSAKLL